MALIQSIFQALISLYSLFINILLLPFRSFHSRTTRLELPLTATPTTTFYSPRQSFQASVFSTSPLRQPPIAFRAPRGAPRLVKRADPYRNYWTRFSSLPNGECSIVINVCEPSVQSILVEQMSTESSPIMSSPRMHSSPAPSRVSPRMITAEIGECFDITQSTIGEAQAETTTSTIESDSSSEPSFNSSVSSSPPQTPSPPFPPLNTPRIVVVDVEDQLNGPAGCNIEKLGFGRNVRLEYPVVDVTTKSSLLLNPIVIHAPHMAPDIKFVLHQRNVPLAEPATPLQRAVEDDSLTEDDTEQDISMYSTTTEDEELDWPRPPGPVFQLDDPKNDAIILEPTSAPSHLHTQLPMRVTTGRGGSLSPSVLLSSAASAARLARCHSSPLDSCSAVSSTDARSRELNSIFASYPKEELVALSKLPTGTVVRFGSSKGSVPETAPANAAEHNPASSKNAFHETEEACDTPESNSTEETNDACHFTPTKRLATSQSQSNLINGYKRLSSSPVAPLNVVKRHSFPLCHTSSPTHNFIPVINPSQPSSFPPDASSPRSSIISCTSPDAEDLPDKSTSSMEDLIALLDAEFGRQFEDDGMFNMFANCDLDHKDIGQFSDAEEEEHWSDVLSIESYAL